MAVKALVNQHLQALSVQVVLIFCNVQTCYSEPIVSLKFYDQVFLKVNVKEYILVLTNSGTLACDIENIPSEAQGNISLTTENEILREIPIQDSPLIWKRKIDLPAKLTCEVSFANGDLTSKVILSEVLVTGNYSSNTCFPRTSDVFLKGEIIPFICIAKNFTRWITDNNTEHLSTSGIELRKPKQGRVTYNYLKLSNQSSVIQCKNSQPKMQSRNICDVRVQELTLEEELTINIRPRNFSFYASCKPLTFVCDTNMPTELISWRAMSETGDILDLTFNNNLRLNFEITHAFNSSKLSFPDGACGIRTVSCWTVRAGYRRVASSVNVTHRKDDESCNDAVPAESTNFGHLFHTKITIIAIALGTLAVTCFAFMIVFACLLRRQCKKGSNDMSVNYLTPMDRYSTKEDDPYYSTSLEGKIVTHDLMDQNQQYINIKGTNSFGQRNSTYDICT